jgi:glucosamine--fructose-6-phosphate aminotransferase (isomerizing)
MARTDIGVKIEPDLPDWVAPILAVIPGQAAALRLGELHGVDLDRPHGLHKVTLTT